MSLERGSIQNERQLEGDPTLGSDRLHARADRADGLIGWPVTSGIERAGFLMLGHLVSSVQVMVKKAITKKPESTYTLLVVRVEDYDVAVDASINYSVHHPEYARFV
ncbi:MAG: hypothetical protein U5Q16_05130 [Gammaproteobacteria bacterium]|nr:hypothetical protein [Gammaproteobacteria bacterium]